MSSLSLSLATTPARWPCAIPDVWLYGAAIDSNRGSGTGHRYSSAGTVLPGTVASTTRTPALVSSGTSVATTVSIPPYPSGGTGSHGPAFIKTVRVIGVLRDFSSNVPAIPNPGRCHKIWTPAEPDHDPYGWPRRGTGLS